MWLIYAGSQQLNQATRQSPFHPSVLLVAAVTTVAVLVTSRL
jgi:hypothetical protein